MITLRGVYDSKMSRRKAMIVRCRGFSRRIMNQPDFLNQTLTYAIWDGSALKFGQTTGHPHIRLSQLQTGSSNTLLLLAYTSTITEERVHLRYRRLRLRGEWFKLDPVTLSEVSRWDWLDEELYDKLHSDACFF